MAEESLCAKTPCGHCKYRYGNIGPYLACGYILVEQKRRPCPAGKDCTVFEKGRSFSEKTIGHRATVKIERKCVRCGVTFMAGSKAKYCPTCKEALHKIQEAESKARKLSERKSVIRTCPSCGKDFESISYQKSFCQECRETYTKDQLQRRRKKWLQSKK